MLLRAAITPASTFKIAISLIGYDAGFLAHSRATRAAHPLCCSPAIAIAVVAVLGTLLQQGPLWSLPAWGKQHRVTLASEQAPHRVYDMLRLPSAVDGRPISVEITKGPKYDVEREGIDTVPQMAI